MNNETKKGKLVPELRFPGFEGEWEEKKLGEIGIFSKGKGISKAETNPNGVTPCIRYGELYTKYGEQIYEVFSMTNLPLEQLVLSETNDVIIPASGETHEDIATASCILKSGIAIGGDINIIKTSLNGTFLSFFLNSALKHQIARIAQGDAVVHLYGEQLKKLYVKFPSLPEQQKIAECLSSVDNLIQAESDQLQALKDHKKGLMQQLFPQEGETTPKLRFPGFEGEWEEKKLGNCFEIGSGRDYKHLSKGNIPVYGSGGYMCSVNDYLFDGDSACIGRKGTINNPVLLHGKFWTVDTLFYTYDYVNTTAYFVYLLFQNINWMKHNEAGGVPSLSKTIIKSIKVYLPSLPEQQKIASCLSSLDEGIAAQQEKVEALKEHKKGLMQKLFPTIN